MKRVDDFMEPVEKWLATTNQKAVAVFAPWLPALAEPLHVTGIVHDITTDVVMILIALPKNQTPPNVQIGETVQLEIEAL